VKIYKFYIYYGGYSSGKWEVKWEEREMRYYRYETFPETYAITEHELRLPGFINALSSITECWLAEYLTDICDGTQWEIDIRIGKHKFKFYGSNDYPQKFEEFLHAARIFLNDHEFAN
jgi:hypothetical protein